MENKRSDEVENDVLAELKGNVRGSLGSANRNSSE